MIQFSFCQPPSFIRNVRGLQYPTDLFLLQIIEYQEPISH